MAASSLPAGAAATEYILEDARFSGQQIHTFEDHGQPVTVVLGDFKLVLGERRLSGRDAVLWVRQSKSGQAVRHDITVYVEGDARLLEGGGRSVQDRSLLVTLHQQGRLIAEGPMSRRDLTDLPLYLRAAAAREGPKPAPGQAESAPAPHEPPELIVQTQPGPPSQPASQTEPAVPLETLAPGEQVPPGPQAPQGPAPAPAEGPGGAVEVKRPEASPTPAPPAPPGKVPKPAPPVKPKPIEEVHYFAQSSVILQRGGQRIIVAKGDVYLSQGSADSDLFLELTSQAAVIFTEKRVPGEKETRSPLSPDIKGVRSPLPGSGQSGERETITGVYLEGDVTVRRGERYLRGPSAYYDFTTDRALIPHGVFRTVQEQRDIPVYIRAEEVRTLSAREVWFRDARITSSDFYTPSYDIGATRVYLMDNAEYDEKGVRITPPQWNAEIHNATFDIAGFPVLYWPYLKTDVSQEHVPLRRAQLSQTSRYGFGVETEWHLFQLLGLLQPEGYSGTLELDAYERGVLGGIDLDYERILPNRQYSGYWMLYGLFDAKQEDKFGRDRNDVPAPPWRGRALLRHKEILPDDWLVQMELSYLCDKNFLEEFFSSEFYAGKEQETLLYAKKQRDNWAFTSLLKYRLNRFQTQAESLPDLGFNLVGEPVLQDLLLLYSESHLGMERFRTPDGNDPSSSRIFPRADTRNEADLPLHLGPLNLQPYVVGRETYWGEAPEEGEHNRLYGQAGVKTDLSFWRIYDVHSRLWDVDRIRHIVTPEATLFASDAGGVHPSDLYPLDPGIEQHLARLSGAAFGVLQRWQTRRGPEGDRHVADWMRLHVIAGLYNGDEEITDQRSDGRFFWYRPEYSLARDHINADYTWNISDATTFLADTNYDIRRREITRADAGLAVSRNPRVRYYAGMRYTRDLNSAVGTFGANYKINSKYSVSFFEQYDFKFHDGMNLASSIQIVRKLPRWFISFGFGYDASQDDILLFVSVWPEGVPEVRIGGDRLSLLGRSTKN